MTRREGPPNYYTLRRTIAIIMKILFLGMLVNGFVNVSISTLEKRFGFKSSETGVMAVGYDIGFCIITLFVTYFGARSHRPRMVAIGAFVMGVGALTFWLPHFTTPLYQYSEGFEGKSLPMLESVDQLTLIKYQFIASQSPNYFN